MFKFFISIIFIIGCATAGNIRKKLVEGSWTWECCQGKYYGTMELRQTSANDFDGSFQDRKNLSGGSLKGTAIGNRVEYTRTLPGLKQDYTCTMNEEWDRMECRITGSKDPSVNSEFKAWKK